MPRWRGCYDPRMQVCLLKSKIHRASITDGNLKYEGSLTIAADVIEKCGLTPYEGILCSNMANGNRFETYAIPGDPGSGQIVSTAQLPSREKEVTSSPS